MLEFIKGWGGLSAGIGAIFFAGRKTQWVNEAIENNGEKIAKNERRIEVLENGRAAADVKIAELPTRLELGAMRASIEARIENGINQLSSMIAGHQGRN